MSEIKSVFAISEAYEGVSTSFGVFTTRELAVKAMNEYLLEIKFPEYREQIAKGMYVEEIELHA